MSGKRKRMLSQEERRLWAHVSRAFQPLKSRPLHNGDGATLDTALFGAALSPQSEKILPALKPFHPERKPPQAANGARKAVPPVAKPTLPPITAIERKALRAVRRGTTAVDGVLDLHGMYQTEAHHALLSFLRRSQAKGASLVLVVTGKGAVDSGFHRGPDERGVLKRVVPQWLGMPDARAYVVSFGEAAQHHGGTGALYVRLRRART